MDRKFEQGNNSEPLGVPEDLFTDPAKYDGGIPHWKRTIGFLKQYQVSKPKGREVITDQFTAFMLKDLKNIPQIMQNLELVLQTKPDLFPEDLFKQVAKSIDTRAARRTDLQSWTPDKIETLFQIGIDSPGIISEFTGRVKWRLFNAPRTVDEAVDLFYNAAWAMVQTDNFDVKEDIFSMLCLEQNGVINEQSMSVWLAEFGLISPNDATLSRYSAFLGVLRSVGILIEGIESLDKNRLTDSARFERRGLTIGSAYKGLPMNQKIELQKVIDGFSKKNPRRVQQYRTRAEKIKGEGNTVDSLPFEAVVANGLSDKKIDEVLAKRRSVPQEYDNLAVDANDPLNILVKEKINPYINQLYLAKNEADLASRGYQRLLGRCLELPQGLELQIFARDVVSPEQKAEIIREVYSTFSVGEAVNLVRKLTSDPKEVVALAQRHLGLVGNFDNERRIVYALQRPLPIERLGALGGILEYHRPSIPVEKVNSTNEQIKKLRQDLRTSFVRGVGRRGYQIVVTDPILRQFGYESISFRQNQGNTLTTTISINGKLYEFKLNSEHRVIRDGDLKRFKSLQDQAWLELLTLSHLKRLLCTGEEEEELKSALIGGERQYHQYRRQITDRIEHLRKLPAGQYFSAEQYTKCLKSHFQIKDLIEINRMKTLIGKGGTRETGIWTYVSGIEKDIDTQTVKPIKIAFSGLSDDVRKVVPLGEVSPEELARIENEILSEMERS